jgi:hypothetical protein
VPRGSWLALESHFVNATTSVGTGGVDIVLHAMDPSLVQDWIGVYMNIMNGIHVPPMQSAVLGARCATNADTTVFLFTSHMHHFGSEFDINLVDADGTVNPLYVSTDWEHPKIDDRAAQPVPLTANQQFEWKCHYTNDRSQDLWGGDSAIDNEMCIMAAFYYPAQDGVPYCFANAATQ